MNRQKSTDH